MFDSHRCSDWQLAAISSLVKHIVNNTLFIDFKMNFTHNPPGAVPSVVPVFPGTVDCIDAVNVCIGDPECKRQFRHLEYCVDEEAVAPLSLEGRQACVDAQNNLMHYQNLQECKCQRGFRLEQQCLSIYWTVRFPQGKRRKREFLLFVWWLLSTISPSASLLQPPGSVLI